MSKIITISKSILFTIFIPGTVGVALPYYFSKLFSRVEIGFLRFLGLVILALGLFFYITSVLSFIKLGGTPQIYFMKKIEKIFGIEPNKLAKNGIYNFSRNPMYIGVVLTIIGQGFLYESLIVISWGLIFFLITNIIVIYIEEPHLKEKYGEEYEKYLNNTPRWIGLPKVKD